MSERIDVSVYASRVGDTFRLDRGEGQTLALELVEAKDLGGRPAPAGRISTYALLFRSSGEKRHVAQGTYRLDHDVLGTQEMFLVPLGPDDVGMRYEAIFN